MQILLQHSTPSNLVTSMYRLSPRAIITVIMSVTVTMIVIVVIVSVAIKVLITDIHRLG